MLRKKIHLLLFIFSVYCRSPFPDQTTDEFQNQCLKLHNNYRSLHSTDPLQMDESIISYAKSRCNYISRFDSLSAGHSGLQLGTYGENLYWSGSTDGRPVSANNAIKSWYDEIKYYSYSNPTFGSGTGHFTQLVWKSTTRVGCALCGGQGGQWFETYVVCNYQPAGNVMGKFAQNVLPLSGKNPGPIDNDPNPEQQNPNQWPTNGISSDNCRCNNSLDDSNGPNYQYITWN